MGFSRLSRELMRHRRIPKKFRIDVQHRNKAVVSTLAILTRLNRIKGRSGSRLTDLCGRLDMDVVCKAVPFFL